MLDFRFGPNHKFVRGKIIFVKEEVWLSSDWFTGFTDLEMKNHEPSQTKLVSIGSDRFQTDQTRSDIFSVWLGLDFRFRWFCPNHLHP